MSVKLDIDPTVARITDRLTDAGYEAFVVGGAVRDLLLGIQPKDYDVATSARPEQVREVFGRGRSRIIGRRFRLVHVYTDQGVIEVSTFRREPTPEERQGRENDDGVMLWRDNEYGSLEQDARRRDFTVNALYYDPSGARGIIDLVDGIKDLEARVARVIGDASMRLREDPVRLLRALKLVGQFGFSLEASLEAGVREMANTIAFASRARLFEELLKILGGAHSASIFAAFHRYGLLPHFWANLDAVWEAPGLHVQKLLRERDARVATGNYSMSKALAIATIALPAAASALGCTDLGNLWEHEEGLERTCRRAIQSFFAPLPASRFLSARARDIILLQPRLKTLIPNRRIVHHPEYKYARELFLLLAVVHGWDSEFLEIWPPPKGTDAGASVRGESRPRRGRGRRRRRDQHKTP